MFVEGSDGTQHEELERSYINMLPATFAGGGNAPRGTKESEGLLPAIEPA